MKHIGIDGCKGGWIAIILEGTEMTFRIESQIDQFQFENSFRVFIDMPMGLSSPKFPRTLEGELRNILRPHRHSSVFTPPCRTAVYASGYEEAKQLNIEQTGKSISIQAWNISNKIKQLDRWLIGNATQFYLYFEAHPELCFFDLNGRKHLEFSKREKGNKGVEERLGILANYFPRVESFYQEILTSTKRSTVAKDDIVDALCLCIASKCLGENEDVPVIDNAVLVDEREIPMRIVRLNENL